MRRASLSYTAAVAALASLASCKCNDNSISSSSAELVIRWVDASGTELLDRDAQLDFGKIPMGASASQSVFVRNVGAAPLALVSLTGADAVFAADLALQPELSPGEERELKVTFTPPQAADPFTPSEDHAGTLTVTASGTKGGEDTAQVHLSGTAVAGSCALPRSVDFGKVPVGERFAQEVDLKNVSALDQTATIGGPTSTTGDHLAFGVAPQANVTVPANGQAAISISFAPTEKRAYAASVKMRAGAGCPEGDVALTGEGWDDVLSWSPASLDFGYVDLNLEVKRAVTFVNQSLTPIHLRNIAAPAGYLAATELVLPGGASTTLPVSCKPTTPGPHNGQLTFDTGLSKTPQGAVALACSGGGPRIKVIPSPNLAFDVVPLLNPPIPWTKKLTVMNVGTRPTDGNPMGNLLLGSSGQLPYASIRPTNANTAAGEFSLAVGQSYDPAVGIEAVAGKNLLDLTVTLAAQTVGEKRADLTIYSNDPLQPEVHIALSALAQVEPPCTYSVSPASLDFGTVAAGTAVDRVLTVVAYGNCLVGDFDIAPGSDPAFSLVGAPTGTQLFSPGTTNSLNLKVRFTAPPLAPQHSSVHNGFVTFSASSPSKPQAMVPLVAFATGNCVEIEPDHWDFGTVKVGCHSAPHAFLVYNICTIPVAATGASITGSPEFAVDAPNFGASGIAVSTDSPLQVNVRYGPVDLGSDQATLQFDTSENGLPNHYQVPLSGIGDNLGLHVDLYTQDVAPKADILFTIDDSCSMSDKQLALANNFSSFIQFADNQPVPVDYHLAVTTTDMDAPYRQGRFIGTPLNPTVLTRATPDVENKFKEKAQVGISGSGFEQGLAPSIAALTSPLVGTTNQGFLRRDASLAVVVVTDAADQSPNSEPFYLQRFESLKGSLTQRRSTFNVIGPFSPMAPAGCTYDGTSPDDGRYHAMVASTGGVQADICTSNWSSSLQQLGQKIFGLQPIFYLTTPPDLTGGRVIGVTVNGVSVAGWSYDPVSNAIVFNPGSEPKPGDQVQITYYALCQ